MRRTVVIVLAGLAVLCGLAPQALAQYRGARDYMKRLGPAAPAPKPRPAPPAPSVTPPSPAPAVDPERAKAEKEAAAKRTVEFQKKRAEAGSASAQYDLALRYLKGDGVEKDLAAAKKWLAAAAKNGHTLAAKKLEEVSKTEEGKPAKE
jgi:TPR repeat protein